MCAVRHEFPRSHALRGNAVWDALRPVFIRPNFNALTTTLGAARGNETSWSLGTSEMFLRPPKPLHIVLCFAL